MAQVGQRDAAVTPTLLGRWQTRLLLLLTVGVLCSLPFVLVVGPTPLLTLGLVLILGCGWDCLYDFIQRGRWDQDWPAAYQFFAGVWEGLATFGVGLFLSKWFGPLATPPLTFLAHYSVVWTATFLASQSLLRIIFPRWRYRGGQWLP